MNTKFKAGDILLEIGTPNTMMRINKVLQHNYEYTWIWFKHPSNLVNESFTHNHSGIEKYYDVVGELGSILYDQKI
jgi:hypothetical protein